MKFQPDSKSKKLLKSKEMIKKQKRNHIFGRIDKKNIFIKRNELKTSKSKKIQNEKKMKKNTQKQPHSLTSEVFSEYSYELHNKFLGKNDKNSQLTKLQQKMKLKLLGGKFRMINEHLYNITSKEALEFFKKYPNIYEQYHLGFQKQVLSWPKNPVDLMIEELQIHVQKIKKSILKVADLGCGDAKIAKVMKNISNIKIYSCDLISRNSFVTACDMSYLPLNSSTIDIVIFCLSLMGTNYIDFLKEAWRILKMGGELWIVEIKSRFEDNEGTAFSAALALLGFSLVKKDTSNKMFIY
ncbi:hypothetical protein PCANB_000586 [Pneumocystis canis]|nr:hypothetical protein PCANB_000586 [Pneumocystis canis]